MNSFNQSVGKLSALLNAGQITPQEFEKRRQSLINGFIGGSKGGPRVPRGFGGRGFGGFGGGFGMPRRGFFTPYQLPFAMGFGGMGGYGGMGYGMGGAGPMRRGYRGKGFGMPRRGYGGMMMPFRKFGGGFMPRKAFMGGMMRFKPYNKGPSKRLTVSTAVKVQPVPDGVQLEELTAAFSKYGTVVLAVIKEGTPRHAYVNYGTNAEASKAAFNGTVTLKGQACSVILARAKRPPVAEGEPSSGIGIFNIPISTTQEELANLVSAHAGFENLKMVKNKVGVFRGFAFAYFDTVEHATAAKTALKGMTVGDRVLDAKFSNKSADDVFAETPLMITMK